MLSKLLCLLFALAPVSAAFAESIIAFAKGESICTATADGKNVKVVVRNGADPCISGDGRLLVYTASQGGEKNFTRSLRVRDLASGKEITLPANGAQQVYGGLFSPDDQWIAFNTLLKQWQVAVVHPDGSGLRVLTGKEKDDNGTFLAGWNCHDNAVLAQDLSTMQQIAPDGKVAWTKPAKEVLGADSTGSDQRCTITADGKLLVTIGQVEKDEFSNLDGPSSFLVVKEMPDGAPKRVTPKQVLRKLPLGGPRRPICPLPRVLAEGRHAGQGHRRREAADANLPVRPRHAEDEPAHRRRRQSDRESRLEYVPYSCDQPGGTRFVVSVFGLDRGRIERDPIYGHDEACPSKWLESCPIRSASRPGSAARRVQFEPAAAAVRTTAGAHRHTVGPHNGLHAHGRGSRRVRQPQRARRDVARRAIAAASRRACAVAGARGAPGKLAE